MKCGCEALVNVVLRAASVYGNAGVARGHVAPKVSSCASRCVSSPFRKLGLATWMDHGDVFPVLTFPTLNLPFLLLRQLQDDSFLPQLTFREALQFADPTADIHRPWSPLCLTIVPFTQPPCHRVIAPLAIVGLVRSCHC